MWPMSNILCPACGHHIATLSDGRPGTPRGVADPGLQVRVEEWLEGSGWSGSRQTTELFEEYQRDTGDVDASIRRWAMAMQNAGIERGRSTGGVRVWRRSHRRLPD